MTEPLTDEEVAELATLLPPGKPSTIKVLTRAGFTANQLPTLMTGDTATDYWDLINKKIIEGVIEDGRRRVIAAAMGPYPYNPVLLAAGIAHTWRILFMGASPDGLRPVRAGNELRLIRQADQTIHVRDVPAATATDLRTIRRERPDVLHLACHGRGEQLVFEDGAGGGQTVHAAEIAETLRVYADELGVRLRGIVLNACRSEPAAELLCPYAETVVAHRDELADDHGIAFAGALYLALPGAPTLAAAARIAVRELVLDDPRRRPLEDGLVICEHRTDGST
jgi:CHAT domain/Effector-associated domain 1